MESMRGRKNKSAMKRKKKVVYTSSEEETDDFDSALLGTDGDDTEFDSSGVASVGEASNTEPVVTEVVNDEETTGSVVLAEVIVDAESNAADNMTLTPSPRGKSMSKLRSMKKSKTQPKRLVIPKEKVTTQGKKMSAEIESALITHGRNTRSAARQELPAAKRTRSRNKKTVRYS